MKQEFIDKKDASTKEEAENFAPWAAIVIPAEGGYWAFESVADAETWKSQV